MLQLKVSLEDQGLKQKSQPRALLEDPESKQKSKLQELEDFITLTSDSMILLFIYENNKKLGFYDG